MVNKDFHYLNVEIRQNIFILVLFVFGQRFVKRDSCLCTVHTWRRLVDWRRILPRRRRLTPALDNYRESTSHDVTANCNSEILSPTSEHVHTDTHD